MAARILFFGVALLALGACGGGEPEPITNDVANSIERIAVAKPKEKVDLRPVLQPLSAAEIQSELPGGTACDFSSGGQLLLVAGASDSVAKVNGRIVHFTAQGPAPVDSSGGFFTGGNFTISVGRTVDDPIAGGQGTSWEGRIALTDRARDGAHRELEGIWRCAAPTAVIVRTQP